MTALFDLDSDWSMRVTDLRILVMLLLDTLPMLGNVLLLCFFVCGRAAAMLPFCKSLCSLVVTRGLMIGNVLLLCFFVFFIFGIIGVQLWAGLLRNRCFLDLPPNVSAAR